MSNEQSMIERVARALCKGANADNDVDQFWSIWTWAARAAIAAMRTPSDAMMGAALDCQHEEGSAGEAVIRGCWAAAIDDALAEPLP